MLESTDWKTKIHKLLAGKQYRWCVSGAAGFIGSHLVEHLLKFNQKVIGIDNFSTGKRKNIDFLVSLDLQNNFKFIETDICDFKSVSQIFKGVDYLLHQAALGSVPRSINDPISTNMANVDGFVVVLKAASEAGIGRIVYASSSSVYGDSAQSPKCEDILGNLLSPYAASKRINEIYAEVFSKVYGLNLTGLRYFNVFGPRQDPSGPYAAVIPKWIQELLSGKNTVINGDGQTTRDFCYIENVVQANLLSALNNNQEHRIFNVSLGGEISLIKLHKLIVESLKKLNVSIKKETPDYAPFREGDIKHSRASIRLISENLGYEPCVSIEHGIERTVEFFLKAT